MADVSHLEVCLQIRLRVDEDGHLREVKPNVHRVEYVNPRGEVQAGLPPDDVNTMHKLFQARPVRNVNAFNHFSLDN
jgi:hypothetical protein